MPSNFWKKLNEIGDRWLAPMLLLITCAASLVYAMEIYRLPGDISLNRIVLISIPALTGLLCVGGLVFHFRNPIRINRRVLQIAANARQAKIVEILLPVAWLVLFITAFLSAGSLGRWWALYVRLSPVLKLFFLGVSAIWVFWLYQTRKTRGVPRGNFRQAVIAGTIFAACLVLVTLIIALTGKGIGIGTQYWGKSGVPILHWQWLVSWMVMVFWLWFGGQKNRRLSPWLEDVVLFLVLWLAAFVIWQSVPPTLSHYVTAAYPPNYAHYPYSDAGDYAIEAEAIRVGNGFPYGFFDKPLHLTFLCILSWLTGSDYAWMILLQVGFLAVIPGLIYLIGARIVSRPAGLLAGLAILFMQANNLAIANRVQATNVKMAMSESLTAMMLMLLCLLLIRWWQNPHSKFIWPALAGVMAGLGSLVRLNVLVVIPFILLIYLISFGMKKRTTWIAALVFLVFCIVPQIPWIVRNQIVRDDPLSSYISKTEGVILRRRFYPILFQLNMPVEKDESQDQAPEQTEPKVEPSAQESKPPGIPGLLDNMLHAGLHNLATVSLVLPASAAHTEDLDETIRLPYWDQEWDGTFTPGGQAVLAGSLLLVTIGVAAAWKKNRIVSLIPLIVLVPYLMANSVSLVSGGRYINPVDWVMPLYFAMGLCGVTTWWSGKSSFVEPLPVDESLQKRQIVYAGVGLGLLIFISCIPAILSLSIPKQFLPQDNAAVLNGLQAMQITLPENISWSQLEAFSQVKDASFKPGKAMFPRWMKTGEADTAGAASAFSALPFDHLSFSVISDDEYPFDAVLPINTSVPYLPNGTDVIMVGCKSEAYFDAFLVVLKTSNPIVYARPDVTDLTCPLPQP